MASLPPVLPTAWPRHGPSETRYWSAAPPQTGCKIYSWHAPEVECIGKGKALAPYEFGCKATITTTNGQAKGGMFVLHAAALHGNPFDGHTLGRVLAATAELTGVTPKRVHVDKGYRGHRQDRAVFDAETRRDVRPPWRVDEEIYKERHLIDTSERGQ